MSPRYNAARSSERVASFYTGVGSRQTPEYVLDLMEALAAKLRRDGYWLRSGHAPGADQAFERGAMGNAQIFLPWATFEAKTPPVGEIYDHPTQVAHDLTSGFHPNWMHLSSGAKSLMARNAHQVLGYSCNSRSNFLICWADPKNLGGTGQAIRIANYYGVPVTNLFEEDEYDMAFEWAWGD